MFSCRNFIQLARAGKKYYNSGIYIFRWCWLMFKLRDGFTLPEVLMTIGLMSFIALGVIPLLGKNLATLQKDDKLKDFHGIIECFYDVDGNLRQFIWDYSNKEHNKSRGVLTYPKNGRCELKLPDVNYYKIHLVGAGSPGYGVNTAQANNIVNEADDSLYNETTDYYGKDIYGDDRIEISQLGNESSDIGRYNIIKLNNNFSNNYDELPDSVRDAWDTIKPIIQYDLFPAAGKRAVADPSDMKCYKGITELGEVIWGFIAGEGSDAIRELPYRTYGNFFEYSTISFSVPGGRNINFNYNSAVETNKSYDGTILQVDDVDVANNQDRGIFDVRIKFWGDNSPCDGSHSKVNCFIADLRDNPVNNLASGIRNLFSPGELEGSANALALFDNRHTCNNDILVAVHNKAISPADRPIVIKNSTQTFNWNMTGLGNWFEEQSNSFGFENFSYSTTDDAWIDSNGQICNEDLSGLTDYDNMQIRDCSTGLYANNYKKNFIRFTGSPNISKRNGTQVCYSSYGGKNIDGVTGPTGNSIAPCFTFDSTKTVITIPMGKRGINGADYQKVYEKINAFQLNLYPGRTNGEASKVTVIKNKGESEQRYPLITTAIAQTPAQDVEQSIVKTDSYNPESGFNVKSTQYDVEEIQNDVLDLLNGTIIDDSPADYVFANTYRAAEKNAPNGMFNYFNSSTAMRRYFGGPGRGGQGAYPLVGSSTLNGEIRNDVTVRIQDIQRRKTATGRERIPGIITNCAYSEYNAAGGYCNAHTGYGGAVIITW